MECHDTILSCNKNNDDNNVIKGDQVVWLNVLYMSLSQWFSTESYFYLLYWDDKWEVEVTRNTPTLPLARA